MGFFLEFKMVFFFLPASVLETTAKSGINSSWEPRQNNHIAKAEEGEMRALVFFVLYNTTK